MFQKELASLTSLLWIKLKDPALPVRVTPSSFESLSKFFEVKPKTSASPLQKNTKSTLPDRNLVHEKSLGQSAAKAMRPEAATNMYEKQLEEPNKKQSLESNNNKTAPYHLQPKPKEPQSAAPPEETLPSYRDEDKKFEKILPIKKELPFCGREPNGKESSHFLEKAKACAHWGILPFIPTQNKEEYLSFIESIQNAITSKLIISTHPLDKTDVHLDLRLKAASCTLNLLLIFAEAHSQAHVEKYFAPIISFEKKRPSYPPLLFLGMVGEMALYFVPTTLSMKTDLQAKKNLWVSLQQLAKQQVL